MYIYTQNYSKLYIYIYTKLYIYIHIIIYIYMPERLRSLSQVQFRSSRYRNRALLQVSSRLGCRLSLATAQMFANHSGRVFNHGLQSTTFFGLFFP